MKELPPSIRRILTSMQDRCKYQVAFLNHKTGEELIVVVELTDKELEDAMWYGPFEPIARAYALKRASKIIPDEFDACLDKIERVSPSPLTV